MIYTNPNNEHELTINLFDEQIKHYEELARQATNPIGVSSFVLMAKIFKKMRNRRIKLYNIIQNEQNNR